MTATSATFARRHATALLALLLVVPGGASAHAYPDRAEPKVGSTVSASPGQVRIWFDSELEPAFSSIEVHAPDGAKVDDGHGHVDASDSKILEVAVPRLPPGTYRVVWAVVARDGHRTAGNYRFTVK
jgi:methionine-rich copper-binding protein CopC